MAEKRKPLSRKDDLVVQELNGELLIYDLRANKAFCLNETSARVWQACDGTNSVSDISAILGSEDLVWLALTGLKKESLVEHEMAVPAKFEGMSRRQVVKHIGLSSLLAVPLITGLVAPVSAQSTSVCITISCSNSAECIMANLACTQCGMDMLCTAAA
ncbi:MAG TPA: PqqD family protein [Pyrinomonadaceae bacterium]|nr:PqqD family protein [Pyrinomonadaceae bacterium]